MSITSEKRPKKQIKISLIDYSDSDSEDDTPKKLKLSSSSGQSLISLLPSPKNLPKSSDIKKMVPVSVSRPKPIAQESKKKSLIAEEKEESDDSFQDTTDYFSLNDNKEDKDKVSTNLIPKIEVKDPTIIIPTDEPLFSQESQEYNEDYLVSNDHKVTTSNEIPDLDDFTWKKLIADKFGDEPPEAINIVDFNVSDHLKGNTDYLKTLSMETNDFKGELPNATARRKHQITYLAYQAKQRELQLKNEWAANRNLRNQSRARYGF